MKTAIVTGGSRGIGYGIAEALAAENWNLAICARQENSDAAENLMKKFPSVTVRYYKCDVSTDCRTRVSRWSNTSFSSIFIAPGIDFSTFCATFSMCLFPFMIV